MTDTRSPLYNLVLIFLSVYVLSALVVESFYVTDPEVAKVLQYIDLFICLFFLYDFFSCLYQAESKRAYLKWGWIDLLSSIPAVDPLRWGRVSRVIRIIRYLRAIKSLKVLVSNLHASRFETLSLCVFLIVFVSFSLSSAFILEFERSYNSSLSSAESALWWSFLNIMNAKASINQALSPEGAVITTYLNKVGLLLFAYFNSMLVAWLVVQRQTATRVSAASSASDEGL